jgi:hypothetical protein
LFNQNTQDSRKSLFESKVVRYTSIGSGTAVRKKYRPDKVTREKESGCNVKYSGYLKWLGIVRKQLPHSHLFSKTLFFASVAGYSPKMAGYSPKLDAAAAEKHTKYIFFTLF